MALPQLWTTCQSQIRKQVSILPFLREILLHSLSLWQDSCLTFTDSLSLGLQRVRLILVLKIVNSFMVFHSRCKVSDYALSVLTEMSDKPVIPIQKLNKVLINKVTRLQQAVQLREGARKASTYLETCRMFKSREESLPMLANIADALIFSLNELCSIRLGIYNNRLKIELDIAIKHILSCELCNAKAFHCERCRSTDLIFPFQEGIVQCSECFACYHEKCYKNPCSKCLRVRVRDKSLNQL